jgi:hypothetical protein
MKLFHQHVVNLCPTAREAQSNITIFIAKIVSRQFMFISRTYCCVGKICSPTTTDKYRGSYLELINLHSVLCHYLRVPFTAATEHKQGWPQDSIQENISMIRVVFR